MPLSPLSPLDAREVSPDLGNEVAVQEELPSARAQQDALESRPRRSLG